MLYFDTTADWNNGSYEYIERTGAASPVKHFALGRFSHENAVVMPDRKTVYLSDDGTNVVFFKFVADTAGDLSAGRLFAAKVTQRDPAGTAASVAGFDVYWVELAHGSNAEIEAWVANYDGIDQSAFVEGETSYVSDEEVAAWAAGEAADNRVAFLESRKAAAAKGASAEFRKMEGVNMNPAIAASHSFVRMARSEIAKGMSDADRDVQVGEHECGVVYQMPVDADFNITAMNPVVVGGAYDKDAEANACDVNGVSATTTCRCSKPATR